MNLLVIENENVTRGAAISLRVLLRNLKMNFDVNITVMQVCENDNIPFYDSMGIEHFVGGQTSYVTEYKGDVGKLRLLWRLLKRRRKVKKTNEIAYEHLKRAVDIKNIDVVYTNIDRYSIGHLINKRNKIPHVVHLREFGDIDFGAVSSIFNHHMRLDRNVTQYIAISNAVKRHYVSFGIDPDKIFVIYNGVENVYHPKDKDEEIGEDLKIAVVGAVIPTKSQLDVVKAVATLSKSLRQHIQIDFWGNGDSDYMGQIEKEAQNGDVKASLKGQTDKLSEILPKYDVGITCSKAEAFGRVTVEYMMAGLYVIASDTGANPEIIGNNMNQLYAWGDIHGLAKKIQWVYENRYEARQLATRLVSSAEELYNDKINAEKIYIILRDLLYKYINCAETKGEISE